MNILDFLKRIEMSQTQLAKNLGVTPSNVNLWVNGKGKPSYDCCKKLLEMGMPVEDLFDLEDYNPIRPKVEFSTDEFMQRFNEAMKKWQKEHPDGMKGTWSRDDESDRITDKYG